jgi:LysM domain-containing protein
MKRKILAISVLMTAFFTAIPGTGFSQDEKAAAPNAASSQEEKAATPEPSPSQDEKAAPPAAGSSQEEKAATPVTSSPEGKVMIPAEGPSKDEKAETEGLSEYTIVRHDTLWGISKRFLKDPFKWPKIWKQNPYIKNPDLIYPGNIVRISPDGHVEIVQAPPAPKELPTVVLEQPKENVVELQPPATAAKEEGAKAETAAAAKEAAKSKANVLASELMPRKGFISRRELETAGAIVEPKEKENDLYLTKGDRVIVSLKDKEPKKGDRYAIIQEGKKIYHPVTGSYMGNLTENLGSLTITDPNTPAEAVIDRSLKEITRGARLVPFKEVAREVEIKGNESEINGYIIGSPDDRLELAEGSIVYIDKGGKDGLANGNVMRIYRERKKVYDPVKGGYIAPAPFDLGTIVVIDAGESTSSAIIVRSTKAINAGDNVATVPAAKEASSK